MLMVDRLLLNRVLITVTGISIYVYVSKLGTGLQIVCSNDELEKRCFNIPTVTALFVVPKTEGLHIHMMNATLCVSIKALFLNVKFCIQINLNIMRKGASTWSSKFV